MAKTLLTGKNKSSQEEEEQKKRKKQAKKEAKLMLLVEKMKKGVRKAEQKAAKAQTNLQTHKTRLQELEATLSQLHHTDQTEALDEKGNTAQPQVEGHESTASELHDQSTTGTELQTTLSPEEEYSSNTEASTDPDATDAAHAAPVDKELTISSGAGTMPIVTSDENAWPPSQIREEIAQSIAEEVTPEHVASNNEAEKTPEAEVSEPEENTENQATEHEEDEGQSYSSSRRKSRNHV